MQNGLVNRWEFKPAIGTILFTLLVPGSITVLIPYLLLNFQLHLIPVKLGNYRYLGLIPIILGLIAYLWTAWDFTFKGKGTPAPISAPKVLMVSGLYRYVRNPMYIGILMILLGEALFFKEVILLVYTCLMFLSFHRFVKYYEEHDLTRQFGAAYKLYCHAIPRWFPRFRKR